MDMEKKNADSISELILNKNHVLSVIDEMANALPAFFTV